MIKNRKIIIFAITLVLILGYLYRFSPIRIEFLGYYNKVFAHRVNSLEKQKQALYYFKGIELDLVYIEEKDVFDVNHPPEKSIGLNFETYLDGLEANHFPFLWLDIKSLNTNNEAAIRIKLNSLLESKNYPKNQVLIETFYPEALPKFTTAGYKTSYYLKPNLHKRVGEDLQKEIGYIKSILKLQPEIGISSNYEDYDVIKEYFPNKTKYLWVLTSPYRIKYNKVRAVLEDENVAIVLTKYQSLSGNR